MNLIRRLLRPLIQYREFQAALAAFRRLSQRQLQEAGIARADIVRLAFEQAERRAAAVVASRPRTSAARQTSGLPPAQPTNRHA